MDAPGQWLAHVWVIRGQCDISAGPAPHCLHWSRCPCDTGWGVPGPAPHCPPHSAIVWSAPSTLPWSVITIRCETDLWGQTLSPIGSVTEHSSVSCVSFEDINTCRSSLGLLCVYCWWRGRSIYNSIVRVFLFPFSSLATDSSWSSRWSPLLRVTSSASADNVSLSGKLAMPPHLGPHKSQEGGSLFVLRATWGFAAHQALKWAQWMKLIMQDWN